MAIPTPKVPPMRWSSSSDKTVAKSVSSSTKKNSIELKKSQIPSRQQTSQITKKQLPTPPSREYHNHKDTTSWWISGFLSTLISILIVVAIAMLWWTNKDTIVQYLESHGLRWDQLSTNTTWWLFVGKEISLTGILQPISSPNYTHTIITPDNQIVWVRSQIVNLRNYTGTIQIVWQIVDFIWDKYILDVKNITSLDTLSVTTGEYIDSITYIPSAGLVFGDMKKDWLSLTQWWWDTSNTVSITNNLTNSTLTMRYFPCDSSVSRNCKLFAESFKKSVGIDFVDSFWNIFYKLADANTRFVSLDDRIGMYIETTDESLLPLVIKNTQFVTNAWVKKVFENTATTICKSDGIALQSVSTEQIVSHDGDMAVQITGPSNTAWSNVSCLIAIDPKNSLWGRLISISPDGQAVEANTQDPIVTEETPISKPAQNTLTKWDTPQFPLRPGKELKFTSKWGWYTLVFPNPGITFSSFTASEKIGGLSCRMGTKVAKFADKDTLEASPAIIVYSCVQWNPQLDSTMTSFNAKDMTFIIQVNDSSFVDFATHITVE